METLFILSVVAFIMLTLTAFVVAFKSCRWTLIISIPIILCVGGLSIYSYQSMLGYPVNKEWSELPPEWTVIFFQAESGSSITLWLIEGNTTRLVKLPWIKSAEDTLQNVRIILGKGIPVTFSGSGGPSQEDGEEGGQGWQYGVQSYGRPIGGKLPSKQKK